MKKSYNDLTDDELAALHRTALMIRPDDDGTYFSNVRIDRANATHSEFPHVATMDPERPEIVLCWWMDDMTITTSEAGLPIDYLSVAKKAFSYGIESEA